jgi:leucine-zipper of insertion element IS481
VAAAAGAERFLVWVPTAQRWAARYRQRDLSVPAIEAMKDRSSRPRRSPHQTRPVKVGKIVHLRATRGGDRHGSGTSSVWLRPR